MRAIVRGVDQLAAEPVSPTAGSSVGAEVTALRAQLERVQGRRLDAPVLPTHPVLAALLPGGGLRPGSAYALAPSASLLMALLAEPSKAGSWCAVIGMPEFGAEAAEALGVDLGRLVLIPDPGSRWLAVAATVAEVLPVVAVRPQGRAGDADMSRLGARLRDRGSVLLVEGRWPQAEAALGVSDPRWSGLGDGHGCLTEREVTVTVASRRFATPRRGRMLLPGPEGDVRAIATHPSRAPALPARRDEPPALRADPLEAALEARAAG